MYNNKNYYLLNHGTETVQVTPLRRTPASSPKFKCTGISRAMRAVKLCSNKILQFLTGVPADAGCPVTPA